MVEDSMENVGQKFCLRVFLLIVINCFCCEEKEVEVLDFELLVVFLLTVLCMFLTEKQWFINSLCGVCISMKWNKMAQIGMKWNKVVLLYWMNRIFYYGNFCRTIQRNYRRQGESRTSFRF